MPTLHPRHTQVALAYREAEERLSKVVEDYDLTYGEILQFLTQQLGKISDYIVKDERSMDIPRNPPETKGKGIDWELIKSGCPRCGLKLQYHTLTVWCLSCGWAMNWDEYHART
jgi:hypothetical protein